MWRNQRRRSAVPMVLVVVVLVASAWTPRQGSGASPTATFRPVTKVAPSVLVRAAEVMQRRLDSLGDDTSSATAADGVIEVRLVDVADATTVLAVLERPANLYFRPVLCDAPLAHYVATRGTTTSTPTSPVPVCASPFRFSVANLQSSAGTTFNYPNTDPAYAAYPSTPVTEDSPSRVVLLASNGQLPAPRVVLGPAEVSSGGKTQPVTGAIIKRASAQLDTSDNQWQVIFDMTGTGTELFNAEARLYYGTPVADDLDGVVICAPILLVRAFPGSAQVSGNFNKSSAVALAAELNSGALPVAVERVPTSH